MQSGCNADGRCVLGVGLVMGWAVIIRFSSLFVMYHILFLSFS
jgi:hypothetical protein